ncbi:hypothetical protein [Sphingorhabdus contaminans]|uniref:Uncharacterized protein n=1 Tax=Sphingorhabdus contaminans TaxID=1343899 RepID=A0A553WAW8_9SPHN|nr:hypothetical protein [Sphingorhabdus contaminans]TSB01835.1 hypothetical protein FOM92_11760 [Sphingorhabdus contaminans]
MFKINTADLPELDHYPASLRQAALALWGVVPDSRSNAAETWNNPASGPILLSDNMHKRRFWRNAFFNRNTDLAKEAA